MNHWARPMRKVVRFGLYLILSTPLFAWRGFLFPQLTPKVLAFQILVEIATLAALFVFISSRSHKPKSGHEAASLPTVVAGMAVYLGYSLITALWGIDLSRSLWGSNDRQDGLILWIHLFAWLVLSVWFFGVGHNPSAAAPGSPKKNKAASRSPSSDVNSYLRFSYWISIVVGLTALAEALVAKFGGSIPFEMRSIIEGRSSGVFGNPEALGPYLLFHFFFGLYYGITSLKADPNTPGPKNASLGTSNGRISHIVVAAVVILGNLLLLAVILAGQTRGVVLGLAVSLLGLAALIAWSKRAAPALRAIAFIGVVLVLASPLAIWHYRERISGIPVFNRLLLMKESQSTLMRQLAWQSALQGFPDHPVTGWGHDNIYYPLNKYYDPRHVSFNLAFDESRLTWYDKSHKAYLDLLIEKGLLGAIAYLLLLLLIGRALWSLPDRLKASCLAGGLISYLISNAVAFDSFGSLFGFFLFLIWLMPSVDAGELSVLRFSLRSKAAGSKTDGKTEFGPTTVQRAGALSVIAMTLMGIYVNITSGLASKKCLSAQQSFSAGDPVAGMANYQAAFAYFYPYHAMEKLDCAASILKGLISGKPIPDPRGAVNYAIQLTREAAAQHPHDVAIHMIINDFYNTLALYVDPRFVEEAEAAGKRAVGLSPKRQEAKFYLGRTLILANKAAEAIALNRQMISEYPDFPIAHWFLGLSLLAADQRDEARLEIAKAIKMGYKFQNSREVETVKKYFSGTEFERIMRGQ
jgi:O-antigen ligase